MSKYETTNVFTPTSPAIDTFVERESKLNNHLVDALRTPGKQIVLYGHSGCGKTTLLTNKLNQIYENTITTRCMTGMTFDSIVLDGFDQLGEFYNETIRTKGFKIAPSLTFSYKEIRATIGIGEINDHTQTASKKIIPPQLSPRRLAEFFGESKSCWILEDFHKIKGQDKTKVAQLMKICMDLSVKYKDLKLIALGAVGTARQVIEYDKEMNNRVSEIFIPYMKDIEIKSIIDTGEKLLNLKFSHKVKNKIVKFSCGLPSICHQLCLNICFNKNIYETSKIRVLISDRDLEEAVEKYVDEKSDTLKAEFDKAVKVPNKSKNNIPGDILKAIVYVNKDEFSFDEIYSNIKNRKIIAEDVEKNLSELCSVERSEILVFDENSNKYHFNNLFLKAYTVLHFESDIDENNVFSSERGKIVERLLEIIDKDISGDFDFDFEIS